MFYLDNSETSWLVYADWLEDQDIDALHIRQEVVDPTTNIWTYEYYNNTINMVGCSIKISDQRAGGRGYPKVGGGSNLVGVVGVGGGGGGGNGDNFGVGGRLC